MYLYKPYASSSTTQLPTRTISFSFSTNSFKVSFSLTQQILIVIVAKLNWKLHPHMMRKFQLFAVLVFFAFLLSNTDSSARKLAAKEEVDVHAIHISSKDSVVNQEKSDSFDKLIGIEECQNEDEECLKRRVVTEAHLDYIYTQHHKP